MRVVILNLLNETLVFISQQFFAAVGKNVASFAAFDSCFTNHARICELLQQVKPHQIYVAGDLADPHGTHRKCTDAVMAAIDLEKEAGAKWLDNCRIWMYRGAWAEWEIENIEMCVPMSPEELRAKRNCILKHSSQMESAPFLGNDERLFWQRAEDRNHATAELYHSLGLACYEAMEAFVRYNP